MQKSENLKRFKLVTTTVFCEGFLIGDIYDPWGFVVVVIINASEVFLNNEHENVSIFSLGLS